MGKKGKKARAGKITRKEVDKRLVALVKKLEEELKGATLFAPLPPMELWKFVLSVYCPSLAFLINQRIILAAATSFVSVVRKSTMSLS